MRDFRKLNVWKKAHELTLEIYQVTRKFPKEELYGITNQIRRAAFSVPNNIAEGCGRSSEKELQRFSIIAMGSASEVEYLLLLSFDLKYLLKAEYQKLDEKTIEVKKMLSRFIVSLRS
ncbi:MAG: four helix bundle protein [Candidatus Cloacimonetes bacterium]|nr:four helix bundle protein [Candidatus Cloacimonadota bacterium]